MNLLLARFESLIHQHSIAVCDLNPFLLCCHKLNPSWTKYRLDCFLFSIFHAPCSSCFKNLMIWLLIRVGFYFTLSVKLRNCFLICLLGWAMYLQLLQTITWFTSDAHEWETGLTKNLCGLHVSAKSSEEKKEDEIWPCFFPDYLWSMVLVIAGPADSGGMQRHKAKSCQKEAKCRDGKRCGSRGASGAILCSSMDQASLHFHLCTHHFTCCCIGGNGLQLSTAYMLWPLAWVARELKGSAKFGKLPIQCPIDILFRVP